MRRMFPRLIAARRSRFARAPQHSSMMQSLERVERLEGRCVLSAVVPNDPRFGEQVGLQNVAQTGGTTDADIDAPDAWGTVTDTSSFVTAVLDSGIDYTHPDLSLNLWLNQGELSTNLRASLRDADGDQFITFRDLNQSLNAAFVNDLNGNGFIDAGDLLNDLRWENGTDEDGNGFTDDLIGWDFANNDNDPFDDHGHGTHVSGILAAEGNNAVGVAGVAWRANLMVVKFLDSRLHADVSQAVAALDYVTMERERFNDALAGAPDVRLSNNSWEIRTVTTTASNSLSAAIAANSASGMLLVAAAGNGVDDRPLDLDNVENPSLPAAHPSDLVLSVAATDIDDRLLFNSNFGATTVDLAAPGLDILSTIPGGGYGTLTGTSMATPFVTGTAALVWARYPEATALEIKQAIVQGVDAVPGLAFKVLTGGRLNAAGALSFDTVAPRATLTIAPSILVRGGTSQDFSVRYTDNVSLNVSSIGASDIAVTRADGVTFTTTVRVISVIPNENGSPRDVVYRVTAPSGQWTNADNATYRIALLPSEVADTIGNTAETALLGSFVINIPDPDDLRVTSLIDSVDGSIGDGRPEDAQGRATLRAAIQESNSNADANTIRLLSGTYSLTLAGAGEDATSATGDLDIRQNLTIAGAGTATTIIDAASLDRVFHVQPGILLTLRNLTIRGGSASDGLGGGGILNGGFLTLDHVTVTSNVASSGGGGGVLNNVTTASPNDTLTILDSTLSFNTATGSDGGGLKNLKGKASIQRSTLHNNAAGTSGGGLSLQANTTTITNSTFSTNAAGTIGGGLHLNAGVLLLTNVTTTLNIADSTGGGLARTTGTARLVNTIVSGNSLVQSAPNVDVAGTISATGSGNNFVGIVGTASGFSSSRGDIIGTAAAPQSANLAPLANYGGPTLTHRPNVGSGVIETGLAVAGVTIDQRGLSRTHDGDNDGTATIDIGAVEFVLFGSIAGVKYHDLNQNGQRDADEPGLSGWTIFLDSNGDAVLDVAELRTVTAPNGSYFFNGLAPAEYFVDEVNQAGWTQTFPVPDAPTNGRHGLTVSPGESVEGIDFANFALPGEISGTVFLDLDGDTVRDAGEVAYPNLTVFLDGNRNGLRDDGEPSTVTDSNGDYAFPDLLTARSSYRVTLIGVPGLQVTAPASVDLSTLDGASGFRLNGIHAGDYSGRSVSGAGDVNGDGFDDLLIGADAADPNGNSRAGESYVVFGKSSRFGASFDLATLDGATGFRIEGSYSYDNSGLSVSGAGDVNGDGFDDLIIGAFLGDPNGRTAAGESFVIFGKSSGFSAVLDLSTLDGTNGFRVDGIDAIDVSGQAVSSAGDVNGDGFDDLIIGAIYADPNGISSAGESYVVFGKSSEFAATLSLSTLNGTTGFRLNGTDTNDRSGEAVSSAGDVNGDGFDDLLIGAQYGDPEGDSDAGESYVVFGKASGFAAVLELFELDGTTGFRLDGIDPGDHSGSAVSSAGDVNGDGFDDLLIGADYADPNGDSRAGESYVVFGRASEFGDAIDLSTLDGTTGFRLDGIDSSDVSGRAVSGAGDVNGDGIDDLLIGAVGGDPDGNSGAGESYVVFGKSSGFAAALNLGTLDGTTGFRLDGADLDDRSGSSVSSAGDVNGDGFDDVLIGALSGDPNGSFDAGESYVVFGRGTSTRPVFLDGGEERQAVNFGLRPPTASIRGQLFQDRNRNGVREAGEVAVVGAEVFIDANENDRRDAGEPVAVTTSNGSYEFSNLNAFTSVAESSRSYRIVELVSDDRLELVQTVPQRSFGNVEVTQFAVDSQLRTGVDIATDGLGGFLLTGSDGSASGFNEQAVFRISGDGETVGVFAAADHPQGVVSDGVFAYWSDLDAEGTRTRLLRKPLEGGQAEVSLSTYENEFQFGDSLNPSGEVPDGPIAVSDLALLPDGFGDSDLITVDAVQGRVGLLPAFTWALQAARGTAELIEFSAYPVTEPRYEGFLETARQQYLDVFEDTFYLIDTGYVAPGVDRTLDIAPSISRLPLNSFSIEPLFEGNLPSYEFFGQSGEASTPRGIAVANDTIFVTGDRAIYALPMTGGTPTVIAADERFDHLSSLTFFNDALYVIDNGNVSEANATIWKIDLHTGEPLPRTVHVDETSDSRAWDIVLTPGMVAENVDFARYDPNAAVGASGDKSLSGRLFQDLNGNGVAELGEPGLVGQVVYLDLNHNGSLDPSDRQTTTLGGDDPSTGNRVEQAGDYAFNGLEAGLYDVLPAQIVLGQSLTTAHEIALSASDVSLLATATPRAVVAGDIDRDTDNDVVIVDSGNGNVTVLQNSGDQSFTTSQTLTVSGVPYGAALGNFDGDTLPDLAVSRLQFGHVAIAKNLGNGRFETIPAAGRPLLILSSPGGTDFGAPAALISADFNNDGRSDLATTDIGGTFHRVFVWLNTGNLTFSAPQILTLAGVPSGLVAADFNNDNVPDLVVTDFDSDKVLVWLNLNNGTGSFDSVARQVTVGDEPIALAVGNFDGRLGNDLAVANQRSGSVSILTNDGAANFSLLTTLAGTSAPSALSVADFDGRNGPDLAVTQGDGDNAQPLTLFFNSGDVAEPFTQSVAYGAADLGGSINTTATSNGFALAAVNLDRDQDADLVVVNSGAQTVSTLRNGPGRNAQTVRLTANGPSANNINFGTQTSYETTFDAGTGLLTVALQSSGEVEVSGLGGFVELRVNGALDTQLTVEAAAVRSFVVQGSLLADRVDLSGVSSANGFTHAAGVSGRLVGGEGSDTLTGSSFADVFVPGAGDDVVVGGPGTDTLEAAGDVSFTLSDSQLVGLGTDVLTGLEAARLTGGDSVNVITTTAFSGATRIDAGAGNDTVSSGPGNDSIDGGLGNDVLTSGSGADTINAGSGTDRVTTGAGRDSVTGGAGADSISGGDDFDTVFGGTGNDTIDGGLGNDVLNGQDNDDSILGGDGNDKLTGATGNDVIDGGLGDDTLNGDAGLDVLFGRDGADLLVGGDDNDRLEGEAGADRMRGEKGLDTLLGGAGADNMSGGADADSLDGGDDNDSLFGDFGNDVVLGGAGDDQLRGHEGQDVIDGGVGTLDKLSEEGETDFRITGARVVSLLYGDETPLNIDRFQLSGGAGNNLIDGRLSTVRLLLNGLGGNDTLLGGTLVDLLFGGDGNDVLSGGASNDVIDGGAGSDFFYEKSDANVTITNLQVVSIGIAPSIGTGTETLVGIENIALVGGDSANRFDAAMSSVAVILLGGQGNDTLIGSNFNDVLVGGNRADSAAGTDSLTGGSGADTFDNDAADDASRVTDVSDSVIANVFASPFPSWLDLI